MTKSTNACVCSVRVQVEAAYGSDLPINVDAEQELSVTVETICAGAPFIQKAPHEAVTFGVRLSSQPRNTAVKRMDPAERDRF